MCLTSRQRGSMSCSEGGERPVLAVLAWQIGSCPQGRPGEGKGFLQRTRRLVVEKSGSRATLHTSVKP